MPKLVPVGPEFAASAPRRVVIKRKIGWGIDKVWAVIDDTDSWVEWYPAMSRAKTTSSRDREIGTTRTVKVGPLVADEKIILREPPTAWGFTIVRTNLLLAKRMLEQLELEPVTTGDAEATLVTYTAAFELGLSTKLLGGYLEKSIRKGWSEGLAGLEEYLGLTG